VLLARCTDGPFNAAKLQKFHEWNRARQPALLLENEYIDTAKVGHLFSEWGWQGDSDDG
jgi:hypothetical protein